MKRELCLPLLVWVLLNTDISKLSAFQCMSYIVYTKTLDTKIIYMII